jgi:hypothetical protein
MNLGLSEDFLRLFESGDRVRFKTMMEVYREEQLHFRNLYLRFLSELYEWALHLRFAQRMGLPGFRIPVVPKPL